MAGIVLIFGSTSGHTEQVAAQIQAAWGKPFDALINVTRATPRHVRDAEYLILGTPTWYGGKLQDDWAAFLPIMKSVDLTGKKVALFGLGDAQAFSGLFVQALRELHDAVDEKGADIAGKTSTEGYEFDFSAAVDERGKFLGLVIDQHNQSDKTHERVCRWVKQLRGEWNLSTSPDDGIYGDRQHAP